MTYSKQLGEIKEIKRSETGELYTTVTLMEYMHFDGDDVPKKINKFKRWRTTKAENFWNWLHRLAEKHGADCGYY